MGRNDTPPLRYESLTQASTRTGLSVQHLRRCIAAGQLNAYRCGPRIIRVDSREVDVLGEARRRQGAGRAVKSGA